MSLFSQDSPLMKGINDIADAMLLNLLFFICCLPVFTAGAALSALLSVCRKDEEETRRITLFARLFKANLRCMLPFWGLMLLLAGLLSLSLYFGAVHPELSPTVLKILACVFLWLCLGMAVVGVLFYVHFECTLKQLLRNSCRMTVSWPIRASLSMLLIYLPLIVLLLDPGTCVILTPIWALGYFYLTGKLVNWLNRMPLEICHQQFDPEKSDGEREEKR